MRLDTARPHTLLPWVGACTRLAKAAPPGCVADTDAGGADNDNGRNAEHLLVLLLGNVAVGPAQQKNIH